MRLLTVGEKQKRGCVYCAKVRTTYIKGRGARRLVCPHTACPYTVLDKHDTYDDYMKSKDSTVNIAEMLDINLAEILDKERGTGRLTPCARVYFKSIYRSGKGGLF